MHSRKEAKMMSVRYATPEWLSKSAGLYEADPAFERKLKKVSSKLSFRITAKPDWGIDRDLLFCAFITWGKLERLEFIAEDEAKRESDFILSAPPDEWKRLLTKESKFVTEFMLGKIPLEQGSRVGILAIAPHSTTLVDALTQMEIQFPDEMSAAELAKYRDDMQQFREELSV
jgi:hypothetical protein